jgi:nicotinamidase-related amidase
MEFVMPELVIDPKTTALILIDLQRAIVSRQTAPHTAFEVVKKSALLAKALRDKGATIVYVHVDLANILRLPVDKSMRDPNAPPPPPEASELVPEAGFREGDLLITKRQWGAFFGTDLEQQLHQRGIKTVILGGIATNYGVESTGRAAAGLGFELILVEDAMASMSADAHRFACETIFPLIGRVRNTEQVLAAVQ